MSKLFIVFVLKLIVVELLSIYKSKGIETFVTVFIPKS